MMMRRLDDILELDVSPYVYRAIVNSHIVVCYPSPTEKAPSLKKFAGTHLDAQEYHELMKDPEAVIIDVRNAYESAIGHFQPPEAGAKLIDPKMRNSIEFPKWLASEDTKKQLAGKKVMMYCTGGIRCERATALLNQMETATQDLGLKGVYHCRGGIERYVKTYAEGGFWKGKNYLFDRRMEQTPDIKGSDAVENDIQSKCCLCRVKWTVYRGQFKCHRSLCGVPVIVCDGCARTATEKPHSLVCELCNEGYRAPSEAPDLVGMKRKAEQLVDEKVVSTDADASSSENQALAKRPKSYYKDRVFLRRLPLTATFTKVKEALGEDSVRNLQWLSDQKSGGFYGSCIALMSSYEDVKKAIEKATKVGGIKIDKKRIKVQEVFIKDDQDLFKDFEQREYPPVM
jgi:predicted sulfurtransferase